MASLCVVCDLESGSLAVQKLWTACGTVFDVLGDVLVGQTGCSAAGCTHQTAQCIVYGFFSTRDWFTRITEWFASPDDGSPFGRTGFREALMENGCARHIVYAILAVVCTTLVQRKLGLLYSREILTRSKA